MQHFTQAHKDNMAAALGAATVYFGHDSIELEKIRFLQEKLNCEEALPAVSDHVCNLHLMTIADTGFDLNGAAYFNRYPGLPAKYVVHGNNEGFHKTMREAQARFPGVIKERTFATK